jgi:hypothetical protein
MDPEFASCAFACICSSGRCDTIAGPASQYDRIGLFHRRRARLDVLRNRRINHCRRVGNDDADPDVGLFAKVEQILGAGPADAIQRLLITETEAIYLGVGVKNHGDAEPSEIVQPARERIGNRFGQRGGDDKETRPGTVDQINQGLVGGDCKNSAGVWHGRFSHPFTNHVAEAARCQANLEASGAAMVQRPNPRVGASSS